MLTSNQPSSLDLVIEQTFTTTKSLFSKISYAAGNCYTCQTVATTKSVIPIPSYCIRFATFITFYFIISYVRGQILHTYVLLLFPENVIHNLMIMMYPYLDYHRCWRKGMVIDVRQILNIGLYAVLDMSRDDDILRIKVYSYADHAPWQLLQEIRSDLLDINSRVNLEADDYILIESGNSTEEVSVERLLRLKKRGKTYYEGCETNMLFIKHAVVEYSCDGAIFKVHHICISQKHSIQLSL